MNIKIIYFSGTGNTELISQKLKDAFEISDAAGDKNIRVKISTVEKSLQKLESSELRDHDLISGNDLIGFGFPVYDLWAPEIVKDFVKKLPSQKSLLPIFIFSTYGLITGDCQDILGLELCRKGYYTIYRSKFITPSNGAFTYVKPDHPRYKHVKFERGIDQRIIEKSNDILNAYSQFKENPFSLKMRVKPILNIIRFFSQRLYGDKYYRNLTVSNLCNSCGLCAKLCPDHNLEMVDGKVQIQKNNGCLRCLRCISGCQQSAITFTSSPMLNRYTKEVRDELYRKALG